MLLGHHSKGADVATNITAEPALKPRSPSSPAVPSPQKTAARKQTPIHAHTA